MARHAKLYSIRTRMVGIKTTSHMTDIHLLGAQDIRRLATALGVTPTKKWGQNFVIDPNTVRRIVEQAHVDANDVVVEIGPGLGSLTLALLQHAAQVVAVEIDPRLATQLPLTVAEFAPGAAQRLMVINQDALTIDSLPASPTKLVANLPYNVSVPVVLHMLEKFPTINEVLVMVQLEVADRLAAKPSSKIYGVPSVKANWYGDVSKAGNVGRNVFWPAPNVDSGLVRIVRRETPGDEHLRRSVFAIVDAAFGQRRKTLRTALGAALGSPTEVEDILNRAQIDSSLRGEQIGLAEFVAIAQSAEQVQ